MSAALWPTRTDQGTEENFTLLREALSSRAPKMNVLSSGIGFIIDPPRAEALALIEQRIPDRTRRRRRVRLAGEGEPNPFATGPHPADLR